MQSVSAVESHEPRHRRWNKFATARHSHVHIGISNHRSSVGIDNLSVNARVMISFFLDHLERTGFGQVAVTPARNRRLHHHPPSADQICSLPAQIDLDPIRAFTLRRRSGSNEKQTNYSPKCPHFVL